MENLNLDGFAEWLLAFLLFGSFAVIMLVSTIVFTWNAIVLNYSKSWLMACWILMLLAIPISFGKDVFFGLGWFVFTSPLTGLFLICHKKSNAFKKYHA